MVGRIIDGGLVAYKSRVEAIAEAIKENGYSFAQAKVGQDYGSVSINHLSFNQWSPKNLIILKEYKKEGKFLGIRTDKTKYEAVAEVLVDDLAAVGAIVVEAFGAANMLPLENVVSSIERRDFLPASLTKSGKVNEPYNYAKGISLRA